MNDAVYFGQYPIIGDFRFVMDEVSIGVMDPDESSCCCVDNGRDVKFFQGVDDNSGVSQRISIDHTAKSNQQRLFILFDESYQIFRRFPGGRFISAIIPQYLCPGEWNRGGEAGRNGIYGFEGKKFPADVPGRMRNRSSEYFARSVDFHGQDIIIDRIRKFIEGGTPIRVENDVGILLRRI